LVVPFLVLAAMLWLLTIRIIRNRRKAKRSAFKSEAAYRKFRRESGQSVADMRGRVAVDLLGAKIRAAVVKGVAPADRDSKVSSFVAEFRSRWRARTICAAAFVIDLCHPQAPDVVKPTSQSWIGNLTPSTDLLVAPVVPKQLGPTPTTITADDIVTGSGAVADAGSKVTVRYIGVLRSNGTQIDSSWSRDPNSSTFPLSGLINCWAKGIPGMRVGGRRQLTCPASSAYGANGSGSVPPNAPLVFVVDLVAIG
jgi:peptidylprolyl isomerase